MGSESRLMEGLGQPGSYNCASHGAGRAIRRGKTLEYAGIAKSTAVMEPLLIVKG